MSEHITMQFPNKTEMRIIGDAEVIKQILKRLNGLTFTYVAETEKKLS